ncbi:SusC/RagA family TonB-linked outer membrane protein [Flavobacterium solisilvae]|uniref:SusC/RagA family TonB-linked outer membrane protein n=1 Tax=Flavobacterium solisilvae TaxID=1852019 RepID=A0ABX1QUS7_9FLAO|nr:SusC/RagA family TonB-linked outer membrane protein [Flavobacterium solisilvae]NMH25601.1 SusC/RagA family TonB-linked outer membrane protein [Flavobacterium solisilvae]
MRSKFKWIFTLLLAFSMQFSFAQEKTVTGVVTDKLGPLPGANVVVKGTTNGVQTDFDGKYSIKAKSGDVLEVSYTGYDKKAITVGAANSYNVVLSEGVELQEVIVLGYGKTTKEAYTGTATKIKTENIAAKTVSNVSQALRGEVAGVTVITGSGQPGSDATIRIRGFGSVNGNRNPLYVVDGVPYTGDISSINPADIAGMTVLKDAAATSVYGSRGANGVILVNTKQGKAGKSVVSAEFRSSINTFFLPQYDVISSPEEYTELSWEAVKNTGTLNGVADPVAFANNNLFGGTGINPSLNMWNTPGSGLIDPTTGKFNSGITRKYTPEKWADYAFRTGFRQEANVQFSGGVEKTKYATSFGYVKDEGFAINSDYTRYSTRINLEHKPTEWLKVGANVAYSGSRYTQNGQTADTGSVFLMATAPPIYSIFLRDSNGNKVLNPNTGDYFYDYGDTNQRRFSNLTNGISDATYDLNRDYAHTLTGNFTFDVNITKDLVFETRFGAQYENWDFIRMDNVTAISGNPGRPLGYLSRTDREDINQNFLKLLRYTKTFGKHGLELFAAHESTKWSRNEFNAQKQNAVIFGSTDLDQYTQIVGKPSSFTLGYTLESYFGQVSYNYDQKYYITASARRDGSSRFRDDKWGTFGSVGLGWIASKESFMEKASFIDFLKFKASYGVVGDTGLRLRYGWQISNIDGTDEYAFNVNSEEINRALTWETSKIAQVGFESTWFNNFLDLNVDYYVKNTDNLFFNQTLAPSSGFQTIFYNSGQLRNSGLEFDVALNFIKPKNEGDFMLSLGINGEFLKNKITEMPIDYLTGVTKTADYPSATFAYTQGASIFDFYMREWAGVDPASGAPMWNMYYDDVNGNGIFDAGDRNITQMATELKNFPNSNIQKTVTSSYANATQKYIGKSAMPKVRGAFRLNAAYKNFDLTTQFSYSFGGYAYDNFYSLLMESEQIGKDNWHTDIRNRWQQPGDVTNVPRLTDLYGADSQGNSISSRFITKADFLSLNNVKLGYTFPKRFIEKTGVNFLNIYFSADNLMILSSRKGFNPSTAETGTSNIYRYNPLTNFSFGVKVEL